MSEGRESPPPERQTGAQGQDAPASGRGTDSDENKAEKIKEELKNLTSNPEGPRDATLPDKFKLGDNANPTYEHK